jgi:hypothetical protein
MERFPLRKHPRRRSTQMISLTKNPSMAAPWSGDGPGEGWKWGDFYVTVQTSPETYSDFMAGKMGGKEGALGRALEYHLLGHGVSGPAEERVRTVVAPCLGDCRRKVGFWDHGRRVRR